MDKQTSLLFISLFFFSTTTVFAGGEVRGSICSRKNAGSSKLFVFGDSYVDTGNSASFSISWREPYGITYPGKPSGRFSDGLVLTDFIAPFLGLKSPPVASKMTNTSKQVQEQGMNFAYGGTGVFNTLTNGPNMTAQIDYFQHLLQEKVYTKHDLESSVALVSLAGNDYATYRAISQTKQGLRDFIESVVHQLGLNLKRIQVLGVPKIAVTAIEPLGCLPTSTASLSFKNCSATENSISDTHNQVLRQTLQWLNNHTNKSQVVLLDLHSAFLSALKKLADQLGSAEFNDQNNPLEPCCVGFTSKDSCGSIDKEGVKKYIVCKKPERALFWDMYHPTHSGWKAIYLALRSSLQPLRC